MVNSRVCIPFPKFTKYEWIISIFLLLPSILFAQYISNGQDPASVKWQQINTRKFQVIYPADYEAQAQLLAHWLTQAYEKVDWGMVSNPRKISVIMHSKTAYSNGMVAWAPRRVELYNTPHQEIAAQNWMRELVLHEYRHVVQIEKMHQGFTKILSWLLGEQASMIPLGLYVPLWFLEGDAVTTETGLSQSGRGRQPEFLQGFKALTQEMGVQKYDKAILQSYKTYVPNHYESGYYIVAANRIFKSDSVFRLKLDNVARNWINPFGGNSAGLRDGKRKEKFYEFAFDRLNTIWDAQEEIKGYNSYTSHVDSSKHYQDYSRLQVSNNGVLAWHQSFSNVPEIVKINKDGTIDRILKLGGYADRTFSATDNTIMWTELRYDKRWENRAWSDVYSYNLDTKKKERITRSQRLFAPVKFPTMSIFAAVEATEQDQFSLNVFDYGTGKVIEKIPNPENGYIMHPAWTKDGDALVYIHLGEKGKSLRYYHLKRKIEKILIPPSFVELGYPTCTEDGIYFTGAWTGENNIYFFDWSTKKAKLVTKARFGANFSVALNDTSIVFANYSASGYKPIQLNQSQFENVTLKEVGRQPFFLADELTKMEKGIVKFDSVPDKHYASKKYSKIGHLFNFHSWALPIGIDPIDQRLYPGFSLLSQNKLSTSFLTLGADFAPENRLERYYLNYSFEGWYPKLDTYFKVGNDELKADELVPYGIKQYLFGAKITFPFQFYRGLYTMSINPSIAMNYASLDYRLKDASFLQMGYIDRRTISQANVEPELYFYRLRQRSKRDLNSKWGQVFQVGINSDFSTDINSGSITYGITQLYFPGIMNHHSLIITNNYQLKEKGDFVEDVGYYIKSDKIAFPRGEQQFKNDRLYSFASDYRFPLAYPDWSFGKYVYIKRVNIGLFYDFSRAWNTSYATNGDVLSTQMQDFSSTGGSVFFDVSPLRYEVNMRIGLQGGVNLRTQKYFNTLILSFSL